MAGSSTTTRGRNTFSAASFAALAVRVEEKLSAMEELSRERAKTTDTILAAQLTQQQQINQLVTDMAVIKTKHDAFWRAAVGAGVIVSTIASLVGWAVSQAITLLHH